MTLKFVFLDCFTLRVRSCSVAEINTEARDVIVQDIHKQLLTDALSWCETDAAVLEMCLFCISCEGLPTKAA